MLALIRRMVLLLQKCLSRLYGLEHLWYTVDPDEEQVWHAEAPCCVLQIVLSMGHS